MTCMIIDCVYKLGHSLHRQQHRHCFCSSVCHCHCYHYLHRGDSDDGQYQVACSQKDKAR